MGKRVLVVRPGEIVWDDLELPPAPPAGSVRVRSTLSLISAGTELRLLRGEPMAPAIWRTFADLEAPTLRPDRDNGTSQSDPGVDDPGPRFPSSLGYNNVGVVEVVGPGVTGHVVGDRVLTIARHQEEFDVEAWQAVQIPAEVSDEEAIFCHIATFGLHALARGGYTPGSQVVIIGLGLLGVTAALIADALTARLVCFETDPERRAIGEQVLPSARIVDPGHGAGAQLALAEDPSIIIEAAGGASAIELALRLAAPRARIVVLALHGEKLGAILLDDFYTKELAIVATVNDPYFDPSAHPGEATAIGNDRFALELVRRKRMTFAGLPTRTYLKNDIADAYAALSAGEHRAAYALVNWQA